MSRWLPERRRTPRRAWGVAARGIAWQDGESVIEGGHEDAPARALAADAGGGRVDLIAANDLAVHWLQQPPSSAHSLDELRLAAAARCAHLFGGNAAAWWVAGDWDTRRPFVCAAIPRAVTEPLQRITGAQGLRMRWHSAWSVFTAAHARSLPDEGWSAMRSPARVLLWHCTRGHVDAITALAVTPGMANAEIEAQVQVHVRLEDAQRGREHDAAIHGSHAMDAEGTEAAAALRLAPLLEVAR